MNAYIWTLEKVLMNVLAGQEQRCRCREGREGTCEHRVGRRGQNTLRAASPCARQTASGKLRAQELSSVLCDDLERWDGAAGGRANRERTYAHIPDSGRCTAETNTTL